MATQGPSNATAPDDLPPPYSSVVNDNSARPYGFVSSVPLTFPTTAPGVYPHPKSNIGAEELHQPPIFTHPLGGAVPPQPGVQPIRTMLVTPAVGTEPTTVTCFNCNQVVTTRVNYTTAWHTHLVAGTACVITMVCSLCCLGLVPYCFDTFKDAEHYCPNCNTFIGKCNKC